MKVLLIQSRSRPDMIGIEQEEYRRALGSSVELTTLSALNDGLPWDKPQEILSGVDVLIFGGSGEFDLNGGRTLDDPARKTALEIRERLRPLISHILENDVTTLGICFGHQLIGDVADGNVDNDHVQKKVGTHEVEHHGEDVLFASLPKRFKAQYGHKDSLTRLPRGSTVIAQAPNCAFAALRYGQRVYTTQFHPELTKDDVVWRLEKTPGYLPEGISAHSIVHESPEASTLIKRFVEHHASA